MALVLPWCMTWQEKGTTPLMWRPGAAFRQTLPTVQGYIDDWRLRTPGYMNTAAAYVSGWYAYSYGSVVSEKNICVCPALHLNLKFS